MLTRAGLEQLDRADPLAAFRDRFALPPGVIYLDGNSLGPLPRATPGRIAELVTREWGDGLIRSWNDAGWIGLAGKVADGIAGLVGAAKGSVVVADSTSVNLFKLLGAGSSSPNATTSRPTCMWRKAWPHSSAGGTACGSWSQVPSRTRSTATRRWSC